MVSPPQERPFPAHCLRVRPDDGDVDHAVLVVPVSPLNTRFDRAAWHQRPNRRCIVFHRLRRP